ncbi:hypothetical protein cypCar_00031223 [Cyprinus carpio]|nr:hypothetical protein cypCar_00031223 [Cyprinus carpio]
MEQRQLLLIMLITVSGGFADRIGPSEGNTNIIREEGESVTLSCTYETNSNDIWLYWYRQYPNREPEYILYKGARSWSSDEDIPDSRFQSTTSQSSTELTINSVTLSDSALYYCALRDDCVLIGVQVLGEVLSGDILCYTVRICCLTFCEADELIHCKMVLISLILFCTLACVSFANVITPVQPEVSGTEGDNITLSCNYSSAVSLQWYRQYPNSAPEFLLIILQGTGKVSQTSKIVEQDPRFFGKVNEKKTHVDLEISSVKVTDSALYYCALQPTVTGNTTTLYINLYTGSVRGLHWYLQYAGSPPKILILDSYETVTEADPPVAGVSIHHRKDNGGFADRIGPSEGNTNIIREEGESVTLSCTYETNSNDIWLYWYRQYPNREPEYILYKGARSWSSDEDIPDSRFQSTTSQSSTELTINSVTLSDSALYYCALRVATQ